MTRDEQIYELAIKKEYPVPLISRLAGMTRQNAHRIIDAQIKLHGGTKPVNVHLLSPCEIGENSAAMLQAERQRLGISKSAIVRLAINQAIASGLEIDPERTEIAVAVTPALKITARQNGYMSQYDNKTQALQQVLLAYKPIEIQEF